MERQLGAALCVVTLVGCEGVLGLDEFRDRPAGTGAAAGSGAGASGGTGADPTTVSAGGLGGMGGAPGGGGAGGDHNGGGGSGGAGGAMPALKRVFVTSAIWQGQAVGGLNGADDKCTSAAPGSEVFVAWLSDGSVAAYSRLQGGGPWYLVDNNFLAQPGQKVADDVLDLVFPSPDIAITLHEAGGSVESNAPVWTGTDNSGNMTGLDCSDWGPGPVGDQGTVGNASDTGPTWTQQGMVKFCAEEAHLYCFEM